MKAVLISVFSLLLSINIGLFAQSDIPQVTIKTLDGKNFSTSEITNDGKPVILSFWALWCKPCQKELDAFNENYADWQEETGVKNICCFY